MIFGFVGLNTCYNHELANFSQIICWSTCSEYSLSYGLLTGFILIDKRLPLKRDDYVYINEESGILVLLDGFVYNSKELHSSLTFKNLQELPLPELIFNLFISKGSDFVKDLNGDFAICIYQLLNHNITFFRDHVGIRPLAVSQSESGVFFSTDPMGLCKALNQNEKIDLEYIKNHFYGEGYNYSILPNKKVDIIPPAHFIEISSGKKNLNQFWQPEQIKKDSNLKFDQVISDLQELVTNAIIIRCDRRFHASAHVSGGIDSGVVAGMARKEFLLQRDFYGFSWSPTNSVSNEAVVFDERFLVEEFCSLNNIIPKHIDFTEDDQILQMKSWRHPSEFTFENKVVDIARKNKVNLIFSGWGGDEFISIGNRGIDADLIKEFSWISFLKKYPLNRPRRFISSLLFNALFPAVRRSFSRYKTYPSIYRYVKKSLGNNIIPKKQRFEYSSRRKVHLQLLQMGHLADRTKDWYVHGQQNGIEYRYPLLDKRIIEYMLKVPSHCLVGGNNYRILLRFIGKDILPDAVLKNESKDDPVKSHFYKNSITKANKMLINEFDVFRSNHELNFVDFNLLEKDITLYKKSGDVKLEDKILSILFCLKSAHEFTKGYNSSVECVINNLSTKPITDNLSIN